MWVVVGVSEDHTLATGLIPNNRHALESACHLLKHFGDVDQLVEETSRHVRFLVVVAPGQHSHHLLLGRQIQLFLDLCRLLEGAWSCLSHLEGMKRFGFRMTDQEDLCVV